jgi:hypothetical protein
MLLMKEPFLPVFPVFPVVNFFWNGCEALGRVLSNLIIEKPLSRRFVAFGRMRTDP